MSEDLGRLGRRARHLRDRAALARVPERPSPLVRTEPLLEAAREAGVSVEQLDALHVRLRYDARVRDHWLAIDDIYEAVQDYASIEGDGQTDSAPDNWMGVHFDFGSCGTSLAGYR